METNKQKRNLLCWGAQVILSLEIEKEEVSSGFVSIVKWIIENNKEGVISSSLQEIEFDTERSIGTIQSSLKILKKLNFILLQSGKGRIKRVYNLNMDISPEIDKVILYWAGVILFQKTEEEKIGRGFLSVIRWIVKNQKDYFVETSLRDMAFKINRSVGTIQTTLKGLIEDDLLIYHHGKGRQPRTYKLHTPKGCKRKNNDLSS